ncbi:MAG TPA: hypothetical protein VK084_06895 [Chitinophagaceae bacterium]|nr:hypothetical protein [Chitinophagaceae bacterium]
MNKKKYIGMALMLIAFVFISTPDLMAQCALCGRVAAAQNKEAASSFNAGIIYLAAIPFSVVGFIVYRWYKITLVEEEEEV